MSTVTVKVLGVPKPQGSMIPGKRKDGSVFLRPANDGTKGWRTELAESIADAAEGHGGKLAGPLHVEAVFRFSMPKSRPAIVRTHGVGWHVVTPDADKLQRSLGDALKVGGLITDDSWIARWSVVKVEVRDGWTGVVFRVSEMPVLLELPEWAR